MKNFFWLIPVGLLVWLLMRRNQAPIGAASATAKGRTAGTTTGTAVTPDPFWNGWNTQTDQILQETTNTLKAAQQAKNTIGQFINFFNSPTPAQGQSSDPTANGSGAGVPEGEWAIWN
jgi:TRAP-type uncharacterized transport system fused permease subunit